MGRRSASNWAVRTPKADLDAYRESGVSKAPPSCSGLRWRWNRAKQAECVDQETGEVWWPQIAKGSPPSLLRGLPSKEAFPTGSRTRASWRWQRSRAGKLDGRRVGGAPRSWLRGDPVGLPRGKRKGRAPDRCPFGTGVIRVEPDRRH
ncbi:MAG TPA: hypothetical protein VKY90_16785, partial [Candidatus Dormibacteraeota bacterium]|nr:hypothetical protein [Candidatus Dormibacteraeota bacterium]